MLDPSSSEDSGGDEDPEVPKESPKTPGASSGQGGKPKKRPQTDQPKPESHPEQDELEKERERLQKEEAERKIKLQVYVFVLRCIAYPFNAKQPTDMARRQQKVSEGKRRLTF